MAQKISLMRKTERRFGQPLERLLPEMINDQELSLQEIAERLHVSTATLDYWLLKLGINIRKVALAPGESLEVKQAS